MTTPATLPVPVTNDTMNSNNVTAMICDESHDQELYAALSWWLEGIVELLICLTGLIVNCIAIPILCSKKMSSIFNRLLVFLTVFDNLFIVCCILESMRKYFGSSDWHQMVFIYFLYQLQG